MKNREKKKKWWKEGRKMILEGETKAGRFIQIAGPPKSNLIGYF
jgi:hypothetical protein